MSQISIAIIGASTDKNRYSNILINMLINKEGEPVIIPVSPRYQEIEGIKTIPSLKELEIKPDIITIYVNPRLSSQMEESILHSGTKRVIFNPGSENPVLMNRLSEMGIKVEEACSLVLHSTGRLLIK